jgi:CSLREA domain-containing protein
MMIAPHRRYRLLITCVFILVALIGLWLPTQLGVVQAASGSTITVNSSADILADDGICTLREAITAANTDTPSGTMIGECTAGNGADTIVFSDTNAPFTVTLAITGTREDGNATGDLDIFSDVTIQGNPNFTTKIDANQIDRVLDVLTGTVKFQNFTITNGVAPECTEIYPNPLLHPEPGGGIRNQGILEVEALIIFNNQAGNNASYCTRLGHGGGIWNSGEATIRFTHISNNNAGGMGGLPPFDVPNGGDGGGIHNSGTMTITNGVILNNRAGDGGQGVDGGNGGGVFNAGTLWIAETSIERNSAGNGGPPPEPGLPSLTGWGGSGGGIFSEGITLITDSSIASNVAGRGGDGGERDPNGGYGGNGGGILIDSGNMTVVNSTLNMNSAGRGGTGLTAGSKHSPGDGGRAGNGGALAIQNDGVGTISQSLLYANTAPMGGEGGSCNGYPYCTPGAQGLGGQGGAVYQYGVLNLSTSTVSGNTAYYRGGAFYLITSNAVTTITHSTIAFNHAIVRGGGIENQVTQFTIANSIISDNDAPQSPDCHGALHTEGNLLLDNPGGCVITEVNSIDNIYGVSPLLLPLANNGGDSLTHALDVYSPALDAGNCPPGSTDQRGEPRSFDIPVLANTGNGCDIGAVEMQNPQSVPTRTPTPTPTPQPKFPILYLPLIQHDYP